MGRCWPWHHCGTRILCVDSCHLARTVVTRLIGIFEPRLLEDASQLLGTARFDGWKVCKDAFQLLASAFVHSVECAVSLQGCFSASCFCTSALLRLASVWKKKQTVHPIHFPLTGWIVCIRTVCMLMYVPNTKPLSPGCITTLNLHLHFFFYWTHGHIRIDIHSFSPPKMTAPPKMIKRSTRNDRDDHGMISIRSDTWSLTLQVQ